jgi:3-oxoacyl-[acyl-carrier-protein] synthase II
MNQPHAQVVITGMGLVTCLGSDAPSTWRGVVERRSGIGPLTALEAVAEGTKPEDVRWRGCQAPDPPGSRGAEWPREARLLGRALDEAWREADLGEKPPYRPERCGYAIGTTLHGMRQGGAYLRTADPRHFADFLAGATLRRATHGAYPRGPRLTTCAACSSGLGSVGLAMTLLRAGVLDLVLAGGYDAISEYAYAGFNSLRLIAADPTRPFCRGRDGMTIGEGYAVVVLERAGDAAARGALPVAWVRGLGESSDCHHLTQPHPEGDGAVRAIRAAMTSAGVGPDEIGLISAHATGTPNNDVAEASALRTAFGARLEHVPVVAFKTHIGHALGGAGAAELVLSATALREQTVPPTANVEPGEIEFPSIRLNTGPARRERLGAAMSLSLGFGGANSCAILGPAVGMPAPKEPARDAPLREVLVTGVGVVLPGAIGNEQLASLLAAEPGTGPRAGPIEEDCYAHLINARRMRRMSDYVKLTLGATAVAFEDARIADAPAFTDGCSAILGTTHGSAGYCEAYYTQIVKEGMAAANPMLFAEGVPNAAAAQLSLMLQVKGFCQTIVGTRTAGLDALWLAALRIATGEWERAIVSAGEEHSPLVNRLYKHLGLHASDGSGSPFRPGRGFVTGAGAATLILESRASCTARGARPRGQILAGASLSTECLAGREGIDCVRRGLEAVGGPDQVMSSANGTWIDRVEAMGIAASRRRRGAAVVSSIYGHIAETFSVGPLAAIAGALLGARAARDGHGVLPALRSDWNGYRNLAVPARSGMAARDVGVLCSDYTGLCSAVSFRYLREPDRAVAPRRPSPS